MINELSMEINKEKVYTITDPTKQAKTSVNIGCCIS